MDTAYQFVAKLDADNNVTAIYSTLLQIPPPGCVVYNDKPTGGHARFPDGSADVYTYDMISLWRWDGSKLVRKTDAEIEAEREARPIPPTPIDYTAFLDAMMEGYLNG